MPTDQRSSARPPIDILTSPFARFARMEAAGGILLLVATAAALVWANSRWEHSYHQIWYTQATITLGQVSLSESRHEWVNDGLMSIFFFLVGLEIKRELLIGGVVHVGLVIVINGLDRQDRQDQQHGREQHLPA